MEVEVLKGGVVEKVMRRRKKGKRAIEFGRDFDEAGDGYKEEDNDEEEQKEYSQDIEFKEVVENITEGVDQRVSEGVAGGNESEMESEEDNDCCVIDLSAEDLEDVQMGWSAWKGVTEYEVNSEASDNEE